MLFNNQLNLTKITEFNRKYFISIFFKQYSVSFGFEIENKKKPITEPNRNVIRLFWNYF